MENWGVWPQVPTSSAAELRSNRKLLRPYRALFVASILLPVLALVAASWQSWRDLERLAEERAERQVALVSEHASNVFQSVEALLDRIADRARGLTFDEVHLSVDLGAFLTRLPSELEQVEGAGVIRPDGRLAAVNELFPAPAIDLSDRDYFQAARDNPGRLQISAAVRGRLSGQLLFRLSRDRPEPQEPGGVVFVSVSPGYFTNFYRPLVGDGNSIMMVRADGAILAREPANPAEPNALNPVNTLLQRLAASNAGVVKGISDLDGVERLYAYRKVGNHPAYVVYGHGLAAVRRDWGRTVLSFAATAVLVAAALSLITLYALRRAKEEARLFANYRAEVERREAVEARLRQAQKLEAVGQLTGGIAHDFNNLLTVILGNAEFLLENEADDEERRELTAMIADAAERGAALTGRLLSFSRQQTLAPRVVNVNALVRGLEPLLRRTLGERVELRTVLEADPWPALIDPPQLETALLNLCINARDAMPGGGELTIETANMHLDSGYVRVEAELTPGPYLMIAVTDTGSGMAPDVAARVFEPFFTTKEVGKGSGLGLSMVYGFIKQSGGHVRISTLAGHGTTVRLFLPRHRSDAPAIPQHEGSAIPPGLTGGGRVLLIAEDDALIRQFTTAALTRKGYRVVSSEDGPSALDMLDRNPETVLLLTDVVLPGPMNGRQLAEEALRRHPGLKVLLTSGYTPDAAMHDDLREEELNLLRKPFSGRALIERVGAVLG